MWKRTGESMEQWVQLGTSIPVAADLCGVSESQLNRWQSLAAIHPEGPIAYMMRDPEQAAVQASVRYPGGNGQHFKSGNIVGGSNGWLAASQLVKWSD